MTDRIYDYARRYPHRVVLAAFLWGPLWAVAGIMAGPPLLFPAILIAGAPFALAPVWALGMAFVSMDRSQRIWTVFGLVIFIVLCARLNLGQPPEY